MSQILKVFLAIGFVIALAIGVILFSNHGGLASDALSLLPDDGYRPSNEVLYPYDISKNPYKFKGHSGILDMRGVPLVLPDGRLVAREAGVGYGLRFEKMINERTATYAVRIGGYDGAEEDNEIAVALPDNDPPEPNRPWRIYVEGAEDFQNGLGATIQVAKIKFEGYYVAPATRIEVQPQPSQPEPGSAISQESPQPPPDAGSTQPAPIDRREAFPQSISQIASATEAPGCDAHSGSVSQTGNTGDEVTVVSDTHGVDVTTYTRSVLADVLRNWQKLLPEETLAPSFRKGVTCIRVTILPDGNLDAMHLDGSSRDVEIDRSCWTAITSEDHFPPLPLEFHGPHLELRIRFMVNQNVEN